MAEAGRHRSREGFSAEVLDADANLTLLGTVLDLNDATGKEIDNRIPQGGECSGV